MLIVRVSRVAGENRDIIGHAVTNDPNTVPHDYS